MEALASEGNVVMENVFDEPKKLADPYVCMNLASAILVERKELKHLSDSEAAAKIKTDSEIFALFSETHPKIFEHMCDAERGARHLDALRHLAVLRREANERGMTEQEALVHANRIIMERTMRAPTDEETARMRNTDTRSDTRSVATVDRSETTDEDVVGRSGASLNARQSISIDEVVQEMRRCEVP